MPEIDGAVYTDNRFYQRHARLYAEVSRLGLQSTYLESDHPRLKSDQDLVEVLHELVPPPATGLDVGCGAEARDVAHLFSIGYDVQGIDAVAEVIETAASLHPEIEGRLTVADVRKPLGVPSSSLDFIICNSVIQHIDSHIVGATVLPSIARVLRPNGVLLLVFKSGRGAQEVYDPHFGEIRYFMAYDEESIEKSLSSLGLELVGPDGDRPAALTHFLDGKNVGHAVGFWRKTGRS